MKIKNYLKLMRVQQWYKNLVVFLAIFFSGHLFQLDFFLTTTFAFISLALVSSAGYIINDFADLKKDKLHPEKKYRPLASGKISKTTALFVSAFSLFLGLFIALRLGTAFIFVVVSLFVLTQIYTFILKKIVFADVLAIATLFVLRAIAGAVVIEVEISPWLILVPFFLSLFLSVGKRHANLKLLKDKAASTRKVLKEYNPELTNALMLISTTLLIISYALYSFLSDFNNLLYTLPFALFVIFRFYFLITSGSEISRSPEKVIKDWPMMIGIILWLILTLGMIYF